jgi:branched-chain amino acid transport system substrate-binding protein
MGKGITSKNGMNGKEFVKAVSILWIIITFLGFPPLVFGLEEVKFGIVEPLTGPLAPIGLSDRRGYELAVDEINAAGGIKSLGGAKLRVMIGDSEGKPETGMTEAEKHIQRGAVAIMGAFQSSVVFATTQIAERYKTPYIIAIGVAEEITQRGFKYTFRTIAPNSWHIRDMFKYMGEIQKKRGVKVNTIGLLYEDTLMGQSCAVFWKKFAQDGGYSVVADLSYPHATPDVTGVILKLKTANPDAVLQISYISDAILITKTKKDVDFNAQAIIAMGGGHQDDNYINSVGKLAEYVSLSEAWENGLKVPGLREADERFQKKYGAEMNMGGAYSYTSVYILKDALERAASVDRDKLREGLTKTNLKPGEKGNILPNSIIYDATGQNKEAKTVISQIQNGKRYPIWPSELAIREPIWPMPKWKDRP